MRSAHAQGTLSQFGGIYSAYSYAYGISNSNVGPLRIDVGSPSSGVASITFAYGFTTLPDGTFVTPLATNAPITIGNGANQETVTPTNINCKSPKLLDTCSIVANFAHPHGNGDTASSGTIGLQEALNAASAAGGGAVIVDGRWATAGGTTAMINAAVIPSNTTIADNRSGLVFVGGGSALWGQITGSLPNQTDLQNALNAKQNTLTLPLSVANGGNGSSTGPNFTGAGGISITGTFPNLTFTCAGCSGSTTWGSITGTLSSQTDLQAALNAKQNTLTLPLSVANGGNGSSSPTLTAGANVGITGTWPNYTISASGGGGGAVWGSITGTLSTQTDLQTALNGKQNTLTLPLSIANGGTGTASPALTAGANITLSGAWPNYTIAASGAGGSSTVHSLTDLAYNIAGTTITMGAPTVPINGVNFSGASTIVPVGSATDHIYVFVGPSGRALLKNSANTYTLTNFEVAAATGTGFPTPSYPAFDCTFISSVWSCNDDRNIMQLTQFQQLGHGITVQRLSDGTYRTDSLDTPVANANTTYAVVESDLGTTLNFDPATNGNATVTVPQANTPGTCSSGRCNFAPGDWFKIANISATGTNTVTVNFQGGSTIYGTGHSGTSLSVAIGQTFMAKSDGANFQIDSLYSGSGGGGGGATPFTVLTSGTNTGMTAICGSGCSISPGGGAIQANQLTGVASSALTDGSSLAKISASNTFSVGQFFTVPGGSDPVTISNTTASTGDSFINWLGPSSQSHEFGIINSGGCSGNLVARINGTISTCWSGSDAGITQFKRLTMSGAAFHEAASTLTFSATPVFNWTITNTISFTLTGNVSSSTSTNGVTGTEVTTFIIEDSTGGRTFVAPTTWHGFPAGGITTAANQVNAFTCKFRSTTDCYAISYMSYQP